MDWLGLFSSQLRQGSDTDTGRSFMLCGGGCSLARISGIEEVRGWHSLQSPEDGKSGEGENTVTEQQLQKNPPDTTSLPFSNQRITGPGS
jgi:hypothetical protein